MRFESRTRPVREQRTGLCFALLALGIALSPSPRAEMSKEELAKLSQNPVANLISVPFQNNTNFNYGRLDGTQNILNIEPVIPVTLNKDWNLITRTIFPLLWQPGMVPGQDTTFGLGDMQFSAFLSPSDSHGLIWGAGVIAQLPTHTDSNLGNNNWGLGPTAVVLRLEKDNPWVYGMLINNVWSLDTSSTAPKYNNFLLQPFVNYNLPGGHLHQQRSDRHCQLGRQQRQPVDRAAGRGDWPHLPSREAAGEHADRGVLQRRQAGQRPDLSAARASAVHVPEVTWQ